MQKITPVEKAKFLACLYQGQSVAKACQTSGVKRRTVYYWREEDQEFAAAWDEAQAVAVEGLEDEARKRALDASDGKSATLLMFLLKKANPEYRDNYKPEVAVTKDSVREFSFSEQEVETALKILKGVAPPEDTAKNLPPADS